MSRSAVAQNYAETLLELGADESLESLFGELLAEISGIYRAEPEFRAFLETPGVAMSDKQDVLIAAYKDRAPQTFLRFLLIVLEKGRQRSLPEIDEAYQDLLDERVGRVHATVRLTFPPDDEIREELARTLSTRLGSEVVPHFLEDEGILGGVVVRIGDRVMDGSVRRRLDDLRVTLRSAALAPSESREIEDG